MEFSIDLPAATLNTLLANAAISTEKPNSRSHYDQIYHHVLLTVKTPDSFDLVSTDGAILTIQRYTVDLKDAPEFPVGFSAMLPVRDIVAKIKNDKSSFIMTLDVSHDSSVITAFSAKYQFQNLVDEKFRDYTQLLGVPSTYEHAVALDPIRLSKLCDVRVPGTSTKEVIAAPMEFFITRPVRIRSHAELQPGITWNWAGLIMPTRLDAGHVPFNGDLMEFN